MWKFVLYSTHTLRNSCRTAQAARDPPADRPPAVASSVFNFMSSCWFTGRPTGIGASCYTSLLPDARPLYAGLWPYWCVARRPTADSGICPDHLQRNEKRDLLTNLIRSHKISSLCIRISLEMRGDAAQLPRCCAVADRPRALRPTEGALV